MAFPSNEITVDSTPTSDSPPSTIAAILPFMSSITREALVGLGLPERFADGAASGNPHSSIILLATGFDGNLMPTVSSPPLVTSGILSDLGIIMVNGPGQNLFAHFMAASGTCDAISPIISMLEICTISGLSQGLPLAANIFFTASALKAFAASPYTVSVGIPTTSPDLSSLAASSSSGSVVPSKTVFILYRALLLGKLCGLISRCKGVYNFVQRAVQYALKLIKC